MLTDVYADLKCKLVARGIPAHEIRFVHEAKTRDARFRLFQAANDGLARVIVGSTASSGLASTSRGGWPGSTTWIHRGGRWM